VGVMDSNFLAALALIVAIAGYILNFLYTKRTFEKSYRPFLRLDVCVECESLKPVLRSDVYLRVQNLSDRVSISNIALSLDVAQPSRGLRFWLPRWRRLADYESSRSILPLGEFTRGMFTGYPRGLEGSLIESVSGVLQEEQGDRSTGPKSSTHYHYYRVSHQGPLRLKISVIYRPGTYKARSYRFREYCELQPLFESADEEPDRLTSWRLEELA